MACSATFVPLEAWHYNSPELRQKGRVIDIGLLAEALVFYDRVYFGFATDEQFARVVAWFHAAGQLPTLVALISDGSLVPYYYAFGTHAIEKDGVWHVYHIQDEGSANGPVLEPRVLRGQRLAGLIKKPSVREKLVDAVLRHHIEAKAVSFDSVIPDARADYSSEERVSFLMQILVDALHKELGFPRPPTVTAKITESGGLSRITWDHNFEKMFDRLGESLRFHVGIPLAGATTCAKTLWAAASLNADLYVGSPLSTYVDFKLAEGNKAARAHAIVDELVERADFPDLRKLVLTARAGPEEIMLLRRHAARFRAWLSSEKQFDRDAVLAYLGELSRSAGWKKDLGTVISAVGLVGGPVVGIAAAAPLGVVGGVIAGAATQFVMDLAAKLTDGWRPVVFGTRARSIVASADGK